MRKAPTKKVGKRGAPLIIGDSVLLGAMPQVAARGWNVDAHGCRPWSEGLQDLRSRRDQGFLPPVVAIQLGTNASISTIQIRAALRILGRDRLLVLLTPREVGGEDGHDAAVVRKAGRAYPHRILVIDWVRKTRGHPGWFQPDGIHLMPGGAAALARFLEPALKYADGPIDQITAGHVNRPVITSG